MPRWTYHRVAMGVDTLEINAYGSLAEHLPPLLDALQEIVIEERDEQHHRKARDGLDPVSWSRRRDGWYTTKQ